MQTPYAIVDAFTDRAYAGNPAAVCVLDAPADEVWMAAVAREFNLSETAFVSPRADGGFDLRWFTPTVEVDLCGHATLATAHVLFERDIVGRGARVSFHTRSGLLEADRAEGGILIDLPADPVVAADLPPGVAAALGVAIVGSWHGRIGYVIEVIDEATVRAAAPEMAVLARFPDDGFVVTAAGSEPYDFVSRYFVPSAGIDEDPVTGAAHCALAPLWGARLGRERLLAFQASARGGVVQVELRDGRVLLTGAAVTVARGDIVA